MHNKIPFLSIFAIMILVCTANAQNSTYRSLLPENVMDEKC